jgi:MFS superfamily sulfate permease-like transporter
MMSGLVLGVESVPDALASGVLAGVNPLFGLYAVMLATPVGAFFASSVFLSVQTTSAMSLVVASVPGVTGSGADPTALFTLTFMTGALMLIAGFLKLGRLMRFVSNSVITGFFNGVALLMILSQLGDFTGYSSDYSNKVARAVDLLFNLDMVDLPTVVVGLVSVILIIVLEKTRLCRQAVQQGGHQGVASQGRSASSGAGPINLRGCSELGSTFMQTIQRYGNELVERGSRLMLAEVAPQVKEQVSRAGIVGSVLGKNIFLPTDRVGESLYDAQTAAEEWISRRLSSAPATLPKP